MDAEDKGGIIAMRWHEFWMSLVRLVLVCFGFSRESDLWG